MRASAAEILPHLLECIKVKGRHTCTLYVATPILMTTNIAGLHEDQQALQEMWTYISDKLLEAIPLEPDAEVSGIMMDSLCRVREMGGGKEGERERERVTKIEREKGRENERERESEKEIKRKRERERDKVKER